MEAHMTDSMELEIGSKVVANKYGTEKSGTVDNRRKTFTTYQYLVSHDTGGRAWYDAHNVEADN